MCHFKEYKVRQQPERRGTGVMPQFGGTITEVWVGPVKK